MLQGESLWYSKDELERIIILRFASNMFSGGAFLWSYSFYRFNTDPEEPGLDIITYLAINFFWPLVVFFANDISSLPINLFYLWCLI